MRHRNQHRKLGRTSAHRKALFRNQLTALFTHDRIVTTLAKAKELRPVAERMVTLARTGSLPARRKVITMVPDKQVVRRLFDDIAPRFMDRPGGYTRIMRVGRRRGDGAELAIIEFVDYELAEHEEGGSSSADKTSLMDRAKGIFGGGAKGAAEDVVEDVVEPEDTTQVEASEASDETEKDEPTEASSNDEAANTDAAEPELTDGAATEDAEVASDEEDDKDA